MRIKVTVFIMSALKIEKSKNTEKEKNKNVDKIH